jgi:hypothetical protein
VQEGVSYETQVQLFDKVRALVDQIDWLDHIPPECLFARLLALVESLAAL